jgi:hypothetical protein
MRPSRGLRSDLDQRGRTGGGQARHCGQGREGADYAAIAGYGIAATPGIVIDGKVMHAGGLPKPDDLARWLAAS